jgi:AcrR family transcriptional regulator
MTERPSVLAPPGEGSAEPVRARRVDARRNLEAILEAARVLLPERPDASMQDIAAEAGVHRATVHRHFASRDDLVAAVRSRAVDASLAALEGVLEDPPPRAVDAFEAGTAAVLASGTTYQLYHFTTWRDEYTLARGVEIAAHIRRLVDAAQREGDLRTDLSADELATAWGGLIPAVLPRVAEGVMTADEGAAFMRRVLAPSG